MALIDTLGQAGVSPTINLASVDAVLHPAGTAQGLGLFDPRDPPDAAGPLVSCLMATSGERHSIRQALACYRRQLYRNREIVIVTYLDRVALLRSLVEGAGVTGAAIHGVGRELTLGEMRNVAVARSRGEILVNWDDDDLYDPARLTVAEMMLSRTTAVAALLWRLLIWWPDRQLAAVTEGRMWEGSIAVRREHAPVYRSLNRLEDTHALHFLTTTRPVAAYDLPLLYVYVVHGANTCETEHFEYHVRKSGCVLTGPEYHELMDLLATRMPIRDYRPGVLPQAALAG